MFHWIRSHVKCTYDADFMTACLFYKPGVYYLANHEHFTRLKWQITGKVLFCEILAWNGFMELYRLVHWNYSCYPMELHSVGVTTRPAVDEVTQCEFTSYKLIYRKVIAPSSIFRAGMILIVCEQGRRSNVLDKCYPQIINKSVM